MKQRILILAAGSFLFAGALQAVPWCHKGTIVQIADVTWSQSQILANFGGSVPAGVSDPETYTTSMATYNYANTFAGGGGGFGGYSVPGSGQVTVVPYAPYTYTNMVGPGYYYTSQGVKFKLRKCYTIPPLTQHLEVDRLTDDDGSGIVTKPYVGLEAIENYIVDPDDDEDYDQRK